MVLSSDVVLVQYERDSNVGHMMTGDVPPASDLIEGVGQLAFYVMK